MNKILQSLSWNGEVLRLLDQTKLPADIQYIECTDYRQVVDAIRILAVRGAPAIGVAAAYAVVLAWRNTGEENMFLSACDILRNARPTAVNLSWAVDHMLLAYQGAPEGETEKVLLAAAKKIEDSDAETCRMIGSYGADLFSGKTGLHILTHCNTGALATAGIGTALGIILTLHERKQIGCVYVDETRPLLQGARLTASELMAAKVPCRLITDNMAASVMKEKQIDAVLVGADRIAANGDTANKIGTYGLAVMAFYHGIPFYVAAPCSTFDSTLTSGADIQIEERNADEVRKIGELYTAPPEVPVYNPAFDVTPGSLVSGIITEKGIIYPPYHIG